MPEWSRLLLGTKLDALKGHQLSEFGETLAGDHSAMVNLANWLQSGFRRPEPAGYAFRLVPGAAQIALGAVVPPQAASYAGIHERAGQFIRTIPRPQFLAAGSQADPEARRLFFHDLIAQLSFDIEELVV